MKKIDEHRALSEQDYGPWVDAATLCETPDGQFLLHVEGGYSKPYDEAWYSLSERPAKPLSELLTGELWADPTDDQSSDLEDWLGVVAHKVEVEQ